VQREELEALQGGRRTIEVLKGKGKLVKLLVMSDDQYWWGKNGLFLHDIRQSLWDRADGCSIRWA